MNGAGGDPTRENEMPATRRTNKRIRGILTGRLALAAVGIAAALLLAACGGASAPEVGDQVILDITVEAALDKIEEELGEPGFTLIDLRTPDETAAGHIAGADFIDFYDEDFRDQLDALERDKTYVIYCRSGGRSGSALDTMREMGFSEVYNVLGGFNDWKAAGLPLVIP